MYLVKQKEEKSKKKLIKQKLKEVKNIYLL